MLLTLDDARHLLQRIGFAPRQAEIDWLATLTRPQAVDALLAHPVQSPATPAVLASGSEGTRRREVADWWIERMVQSDWTVPGAPNALQEKMTLFWHGHFCSEQKKVFNMEAMYNQNALFRSSGLGNFEALCQAVAIDPAMLKYLDNETNVAGAEQENFARELMELFTVGINGYDEDDVIAMAKAWTGHNNGGLINGTWDLDYRFVPDKHDNSQKTLFGITRNWDGPQTITELVHGVKQQATAEFISTKLWRFFVGPDPTAAVVADLSAAFVASDMHIADLLRALFNHPQFWATSARNALIKSPVEFVVSIIRQTEPDPSTIVWWQHCRNMGQSLFDPPDVSGWGHNEDWISSATLWGRAYFAKQVRTILTRTDPNTTDRFSYLRTLSAADGVQELFDLFGIDAPSPNTRSHMEAWWQDTAGTSFDPFLHKAGLEMTMLTPDFQVV